MKLLKYQIEHLLIRQNITNDWEPILWKRAKPIYSDSEPYLKTVPEIEKNEKVSLEKIPNV